jgi:NTP pyrophosphatase (non-canonical NTP hydrolase)
MTLNEYQQAALLTSSRKGQHNEFIHRVLGVVGETGEIAEKIKKIYRDKDGQIAKSDVKELKKEMGDVLWYIATLADFFDLELEDIGRTNIDKLASRQKRGKLRGSGDNR